MRAYHASTAQGISSFLFALLHENLNYPNAKKNGMTTIKKFSYIRVFLCHQTILSYLVEGHAKNSIISLKRKMFVKHKELVEPIKIYKQSIGTYQHPKKSIKNQSKIHQKKHHVSNSSTVRFTTNSHRILPRSPT